MTQMVYCPSCNGKIEITAHQCQHCGERNFMMTREYQDELTDCGRCKGTGQVFEVLPADAQNALNAVPQMQTCPCCEGSGKAYTYRFEMVDRRRPVE